jgi:hypothetical protein
MNREGNFVAFSEFMNFMIFARLITYFGNLVFVFRHFGCVIFSMMFSVCKARWAR